MATITAKTGSGVPLNVLDPTTWIGGVVPTAADYAIFPNQAIRTQFRPTVADNYIPYTPWPGFKTIEVASTTGFDTSGSFYCFPSPMQDVLLPIKIDYQSKSATTFISCSIDQSFRHIHTQKHFLGTIRLLLAICVMMIICLKDIADHWQHLINLHGRINTY